MALEAAIDKRPGPAFSLGVDFVAPDGCLGILGASGSGKSMILKCVAGIETPDGGRIAVDGRVLFDSRAGVNLKPQRRRVGYLFQNYALFPHMTVEENVGIGAPAAGREKRELVARLLGRFRLEGMERRRPHQLSGGQQQRAALARMLAADPEVILLDEPFSALDPHLREEMQFNLLDVIRDRRHVIMVTHSRDEAYRMCSEVLVLDNGGVLRRGPTREVFSDPRHVVAARVTGCKNISRMEQMPGNRIRAVDWDVVLDTGRRVPGDAAFVGIRAHDFQPVSASEASAANVVEIHIHKRAEDLFEQNIIFSAARDGGSGGELWWKYSKYAISSPPTHLRFPPEALLFLAGEGAPA